MSNRSSQLISSRPVFRSENLRNTERDAREIIDFHLNTLLLHGALLQNKREGPSQPEGDQRGSDEDRYGDTEREFIQNQRLMERLSMQATQGEGRDDDRREARRE